MPKVDSRVVAAHRQSVEFTIADVVGFLQETIGQSLVAHMTGVDSKTVQRWKKGERTPTLEAEKRLRAVFQVFHLLQDEESPHTVRAWLVGINPQLDESPVEALREGRTTDVVIAARAYIAGG